MKKIRKGIHKAITFLLGNILGHFMYSRKYFPKGKWYQHWYSDGWEWIIPDFWGRVLFNKNRGVKWPVSPFTMVGNTNIHFHVDDLDNFQSPGCYFQTYDASIRIGKGSFIAQGTGIITSNHDFYDLEKRGKIADVVIGSYCWLGMHSIILPGVVLGDHTIVGAGSVVTHSFPEGYCILAGNPAKIVRKLDCDTFFDL